MGYCWESVGIAGTRVLRDDLGDLNATWINETGKFEFLLDFHIKRKLISPKYVNINFKD